MPIPRWVRSGEPDIGLELGVWEWTSGSFGTCYRFEALDLPDRLVIGRFGNRGTT
jgi:hypothetical protein